VTAIDRVRRTIVVTGLNAGVERDEPYDALVFSPGAAPIHPAMPGVELPVIFAVRTIPDSVVIRTWIMQRRPRSAHDLPGAPRPGVLAAAVGAPWATTGSARRIAPALRPDCRAGIAAAAPRTPRRLSLGRRSV
jgi:NADPH-dependent 2,4-dienoyl-CoA reductase/sulfur reductase-like enzyme